MATKKPLYLHPYMELQGSLDSPDGRGRRYVATKSVSQGAVLLVEEAIVASEPEQTVKECMVSLCEKLGPHREWVETLEWRKCQFASEVAEQVYANKLEVDLPLVERAVNNAFKTMLLDGTWRASLYQHLSFFNHACRPNASPTIAHQEGGDASAATSSGCKTVYAIEDIPEGREVCIDYIGQTAGLFPKGPRQQVLREAWGFECACDRCASEPDMDPLDICQVSGQLREGLLVGEHWQTLPLQEEYRRVVADDVDRRGVTARILLAQALIEAPVNNKALNSMTVEDLKGVMVVMARYLKDLQTILPALHNMALKTYRDLRDLEIGMKGDDDDSDSDGDDEISGPQLSPKDRKNWESALKMSFLDWPSMTRKERLQRVERPFAMLAQDSLNPQL